MTIISKIIKRIKRDERGAVLVEFAFVAPTLFLMIMGLFDFGYSIYARSVINGAIQEAARDSTLQDGATEMDNIDDVLEERIKDVVPFGNITIERKSYFSFFDVDRPEVFTDSDSNGVCNDGEPFTDENNSGVWDADVGQDGIGGPRDVVLYEVNLEYTRIFPLYRFIGSSSEQNITATTVLRNQPFGQQNVNISNVQLTCS